MLGAQCVQGLVKTYKLKVAGAGRFGNCSNVDNNLLIGRTTRFGNNAIILWDPWVSEGRRFNEEDDDNVAR